MPPFAALASLADRTIHRTLHPPARRQGPGSDAHAAIATAPTPELDGAPFPAPGTPAYALEAGVLRFESPAWPLVPEVRDRYLARARNRIVRTHVRGPIPGRAVALAVHGYLGGFEALDAPWLAPRVFERAGYTFAHHTLPFHGRRAERLGRPVFPNADPRVSFEAARQGALDVAAAVAALRHLGARRVLLAGLSLGAYVAALAATVTADLDGLVLLTPLASLRPLGAAPTGDARDLLALVDPASRAPRIAGDRVLVVGGREDRVTPLAHARALADHFGAELAVVEGGHVLPFGRDAALGRWLALQQARAPAQRSRTSE
jgi:pimeloyl-ACP methyl ester carboxylesterase